MAEAYLAHRRSWIYLSVLHSKKLTCVTDIGVGGWNLMENVGLETTEDFLGICSL